MIKRIILDEIKRIFRDKMYIFFLVYPLLMILLSLWLLPYLNDNAGALAANIVSLVFILLTPFVFGALSAFSLLDDRDDQVFASLKITPLRLSTYITIKLAISYLFALVATLATLFINNYVQISILDKFLIAILAAITAPLVTLLINAFSRNKVEGFVIMKATGILILAPIASIFITDWTELFLGVIPLFWPARIVTLSFMNGTALLSSTWYFVIGVLINSLFTFALYLLFKKRTKN